MGVCDEASHHPLDNVINAMSHDHHSGGFVGVQQLTCYPMSANFRTVQWVIDIARVHVPVQILQNKKKDTNNKLGKR